MEVKLTCIKSMWLFIKPALACWATLNEYTLPSDATVINNMQLYYSDEFKESTTRGDFLGCKFRIRVRPGITNEVQTWAHEFAHMIQAFSLGEAYRKIYDLQQEEVGYFNNLLEVQARDAGSIALLLYKNKVLEWYDIYDSEGPYSVFPRAQTQSCWTDWLDDYQYVDYSTLKTSHVYLNINVQLKQRRKVYDNIRANSWRTRAGTGFNRVSLCN